MSHFMSLPSNLIGLLTSNSAANAWCARAAEPAARSAIAAMAAINAVRLVILVSLPRSRLRAGCFSRPLLVGAGAGKNAGDPDIRLVARELENRAVGLLQIVQRRPWTRPRVRILDRELVFDLLVRDTGEALGHLHSV